jgi:hypothetical protein
VVQRTVLATIAGSGPCERLEVALVRKGDGRVAIDLREQHHAEGIGWFDQRGMTLDPRQFRQLQSVLKLDLMPLMGEVDEDGPNVIPFPGPREDAAQRSAVGD